MLGSPLPWPARSLLALLALAGCAELSLAGCSEHAEVIARETTGGGGQASGGGDGGTGASASGGQAGGDTGPSPPRFGVPRPLDDINDPVAKDQDPTLTEDELEIFFFSDRGGNSDLWRATRTSTDAAWEAPTAVTELNSGDIEQGPAVSRDGLRLWFSSSRDPVGVFVAARPSRTEPFGAPEPIAIAADSGGTVIAPSLDQAELRMAVSIGTGDSRDLFELVRASHLGTWGAPAPLTGIASENAESTPYLIDDGRELLFHSGRSGAGDLYWAYREAAGLPIVRLEPLSDINGPTAFDSHPHLTVSRRQVYFGSDRSGGTDLYVADSTQTAAGP